MAKECATPLNYLKRGFSVFFPPNQREQKGQETQQTQLKQNPLPSKQ